jgi:hypothetical protein
MRLTLVLWLVVLCAPSISRADTIQFQFGFSPSFTIVEGQEAFIPAAIVNTGLSALEFGCARIPCGGLDFGASFGAGTLFQNQFEFGPSGTGAVSFYDQFVGLTLDPGERFDFVLGRLAVFAPLGTEFHPMLTFRIQEPVAFFSSIGRIGTEVRFSPLEFVDNRPVIPEPTTLLLMGSGVAYLLRRRLRTFASAPSQRQAPVGEQVDVGSKIC